jgi:hypothetical protein
MTTALDSHLSADLQALLDEHDDSQPLAFGELVDRIGDRGFGFSLLLLSLPSALPVPAPGYSTPFGIAIVGLALQMVVGRKTPWLPESILKRELSGSFARRLLSAAIGFLRRVEHLIKPRLAVIHGRLGVALLGGLVAAMGCLMIIPLPGTNTAPAMVIFLCALGIIEEVGAVISLAMLAGAGATALYGTLIGLVVFAGQEWEQVYEGAKDVIKGLLGR